MKANTVVYCFLSSLVAQALAQEDPGPSPTASVGCEPHGDHWHCDRPATAAAVVQQTAASVVASSAEDPGPSPTESAGCEPHEDHWHCDEPAAAGQTAAPGTAATPTESEEDHDHEHEDEDEDEASGALPAIPSPTESAGCEPHGDHWHCDGPATDPGAAAAANNATSPSANDTAPAAPVEPFEGAANKLHLLSASVVVGIAGTVGLLKGL
ncbi:MAG: hypothetical protein Q9174_004615 [Haloplaca sp. 1 TL-2023]